MVGMVGIVVVWCDKTAKECNTTAISLAQRNGRPTLLSPDAARFGVRLQQVR